MNQHVDALDPTSDVNPRTLFYESVVAEAELRDASMIKNLDPEIALLRARLRRELAEHPDDLAMVLKSVDTIVRAVRARYRMSDQRATDLGTALAKAVDLVSDQFQIGATADE